MHLLSTLTILFTIADTYLSGWTSDGGYIGVYPGGCAFTSECPVDEKCMHTIDEIECPAQHNNLCRCTLGCIIGPYVVRFQQYRIIEGKGFCMCLNSITNQTECVPHLEL